MKKIITMCTCIVLLSSCAASTGKHGPESAAVGQRRQKVDAEWLASEGRALASRGDFVKAAQYVEASIDRGRESRENYALLWSIYTWSGRYSAAVRSVREYVESHPGDASAEALLKDLKRALEM